jgi:hypothetical protein
MILGYVIGVFVADSGFGKDTVYRFMEIIKTLTYPFRWRSGIASGKILEFSLAEFTKLYILLTMGNIIAYLVQVSLQVETEILGVFYLHNLDIKFVHKLILIVAIFTSVWIMVSIILPIINSKPSRKEQKEKAYEKIDEYIEENK